MNYSIIGVLLVASFATTVYKLQYFFLYPSSFPSGSRDIVDKPDEYDMQFEDVKLLTPDGENIHLYVIPSRQGLAATKTILFLGPNAGNMGNSLPLAKLVHDWGYNIVTMSYRGYGKSTGSASEKGLKVDIDTTLKYIADHPQLKGTKLVLYGRSLGGAVAIYAAVSAPPKLVGGMILENTFLSIPKLMPSVIPYTSWLAKFLTERWESEKLIDRIDPDLPVLFMAGAKDELIPPAMFRKLYELCSSTRKMFNLYARGNHSDTLLQPGYWEDMKAFLETC